MFLKNYEMSRSYIIYNVGSTIFRDYKAVRNILMYIHVCNIYIST